MKLNKNKNKNDNLSVPEQQEEINLDEIALEEIMKNPDKYMDLNDDGKEQVLYCKHCQDYTIFVNNVCTVCGNSKTSLKSKRVEEDLEVSDGNPDILTLTNRLEDEALLDELVENRNIETDEDE